jgi:1-acyl-sn-glycerol-3-phosphate acyltransferase
MFTTMRAIPIAGRHERPDIHERAFAEIETALGQGELVCIFPEGALTYTGEIAPFRPGIERILAASPVPVVPMALRGLWGSWFSRRGGKAMAKVPRRFRSRVELVVGDVVPAATASAAHLETQVRTLRGDQR